MAIITTDLLSLPRELLIIIVEATDHHDLFSLRSSCTRLESASRNTFAQTFFTNRRLVMSESSVETLSDITKHEFFGTYLKKVSINSAAVSLFSRGPHRFYPLLKQAFRNVAHQGRQMSLCIFDATDSSDFQKGHGFERLARDTAQQGLELRPLRAEVFDLAMEAASMAQVPLRYVEMVVEDFDHEHDTRAAYLQCQAIVSHWGQLIAPQTSLTLSMANQLEFTWSGSDQKTISVKGSTTQPYEPLIHELITHTMSPFLDSIVVSKLCITDCQKHFNHIRLLDWLPRIQHNLEHVTLSNLNIHDMRGEDTIQNAVYLLSRAPKLKYCRLQNISVWIDQPQSELSALHLRIPSLVLEGEGCRKQLRDLSAALDADILAWSTQVGMFQRLYWACTAKDSVA